MSFFAVLLALMVEQLRPLPRSNLVHESLIDWVRWVGRNFDAGREHHAWVVWGITVLLPSVFVWAVFALLNHYSVVAGLGWNLVVLYLTLGFRQFSHYFRDIREALELGQEDRARELLAQWRHLDTSDLPRAELLRHVIEHSVLAAHRHVLGVFFCFVLGSALGLGPAGAVVYRVAEFSARYWSYRHRATGVPTHPGVELRYTINRFEGTSDGPITLDVAWQLVAPPSGQVVHSAHPRYTIPASDHSDSVSGYVTRLSKALEQWADDIAGAIRELPVAKP